MGVSILQEADAFDLSSNRFIGPAVMHPQAVKTYLTLKVWQPYVAKKPHALCFRSIESVQPLKPNAVKSFQPSVV
jgi:hypothetical protein